MTFRVKLERTRALTPRVKALRFRLLDGRALEFRAGQHLKLWVPGDPSRPMYFSLASPPSVKDAFEICVTRVEGGRASEFMHSLPAGEELEAEGPGGSFVAPAGELPRDAVFVAAGSGVAPLRSMILDLLDRRTARRLSLLLGARTEEDLPYREEWEKLAKGKPNFRARYALSRPAAGPRSYVQDIVGDAAPDPAEADYYVCGQPKMLAGVREALKALGVAEERVHWERYD